MSTVVNLVDERKYAPKTYNVHNVSATYTNYKFIVIRDCNNEPAPYNGYWYYGGYNDLVAAQRVANEICNGLVIETAQVNKV